MTNAKRRIPKDPALSTPPTASPNSTDDTDSFDFDKRVADQVDFSIWRAIYNGSFRLAVRCERCGRWLTSGHSKRARLGPHCKAKADPKLVAELAEQSDGGR